MRNVGMCDTHGHVLSVKLCYLVNNTDNDILDHLKHRIADVCMLAAKSFRKVRFSYTV